MSISWISINVTVSSKRPGLIRELALMLPSLSRSLCLAMSYRQEKREASEIRKANLVFEVLCCRREIDLCYGGERGQPEGVDFLSEKLC